MRRIDYLMKLFAKHKIGLVPYLFGHPTLKEQQEFYKWANEKIGENKNV